MAENRKISALTAADALGDDSLVPVVQTPGSTPSTRKVTLAALKANLSAGLTINNSHWSGTDLAVANGGTGASSASAARDNLGLTIGTNVQGYSATLAALASSSANGVSLATAADYSAMRTLLGLVIGTNVQAQDAELTAIAGLASAADKIAYFTGSGTAALADFGSAARTLLAQTSQSNMRTTGLGLTATGDSIATAANVAAVKTILNYTAAEISGVASTSNPLSQFAATTSAQLRGVISDETGTGALVFAGGNIGAATGTSLTLSGAVDVGTTISMGGILMLRHSAAFSVSFGHGAGSTADTGGYNVSIGRLALPSWAGTQNVGVGLGALPNCIGSNNTGVGSSTGNTLTIGNNNTLLGSNTNVSAAGATSQTAIGFGAVCTADNQVRLGTSSDTVSIPGALVVVGQTTQAGRLIMSGDAVNFSAKTVATLPGSPSTGDEYRVTDASAPAVGSTVAGGGAAHAKVWWNGVSWKVTAI